jgi:biopolymer transport protein ExbD
VEKTKKDPEAAGEANVLPVMNVMFLLIPALLLAMEVASMAAITVTPPKIRNAAGPTAPPSTAELDYRVHIMSDGFKTTFGGQKLADDGQGLGAPSIPREGEVARVGDGYDYGALEAQAQELKVGHPDTPIVTITAEGDVPLSTVVATMDALRGSDCKLNAGEEEAARCLFWQPVVQGMG